MEFNEKYYSVDLIEYQKKISKIIDIQEKLLDYLINYLELTNEVEQLEHCDSFIHLIGKIRFNIESINTLMSFFLKSDYRFKVSINVLYRCIVDDLINIRYLVSFVHFGEDDKKSLNNELDIMHKEHLLSMIKGIQAELEFHKYVSTLQNTLFNEHLTAIDDIKQSNAYLLDELNNWRSNSDIRSTTNQDFLDLLEKDGTRTGFITENKKLKFIEKRKFSSVSELTFLFKYYSQYHHFSPKSNEYINSDIEHDLFFYFITIGEIIITLNLIMNVLKFTDVNLIKNYSAFIQSEIGELGREF